MFRMMITNDQLYVELKKKMYHFNITREEFERRCRSDKLFYHMSQMIAEQC